MTPSRRASTARSPASELERPSPPRILQMAGLALLAVCATACRPAGGPGDASGPAVLPAGPFVRVLGTVQDGGLPHAACACERCDAARRDPARAGRIASLAIVLPASGKVFLIDATPDIREQLDALADVRGAPAGRVDREPLDGVFLTHAHMGHYLGLGFLGYEAVHARGVPVYATPRMADFLRTHAPWSQLVRLENILLRPLPPGDSVDLGDGVTVTAVAVPHRDEFTDTVGFAVQGPDRRLLYVPDTDSWAAWDPPPSEVLADYDVALVDGTFFSAGELPGRSVAEIGHPLVAQSLEQLRPVVAAGSQVIFIHLNHSNPALDPDSRERRRIELLGFSVATEGDDLPL